MSVAEPESIEEEAIEELAEGIPEEEAEEVETIQLDASLVEKMMEYIDVLLDLRDGRTSISEARALVKSIYPSFGVKKKTSKKVKSRKTAKKTSKKSGKSVRKKTSRKKGEA